MFVVLVLVEMLSLPSWSCLIFCLTSIVQYVRLLFDCLNLRLVEKEVLLQLVTRIPLSLISDSNNQVVALKALVVRHAGYLKRYSHILVDCLEGYRRGQSSQDYFLLCLH
jgi:hypothetical protein